MFAGALPIYNASAPNQPVKNCTLTLGLQGAPATPTLKDVDVPSDLDWALQPTTRRLYASSPCGYRVGATGIDGRLIYDGVTDGELAGGYPVCRTNDPVPRPWYIPPNPRFQTAYPDDCEHAYAPGATFRGMNLDYTATGVQYQRTQLSSHRCFAPFYDLAAIAANSGPFERNRQCAAPLLALTQKAKTDPSPGAP